METDFHLLQEVNPNQSYQSADIEEWNNRDIGGEGEENVEIFSDDINNTVDDN